MGTTLTGTQIQNTYDGLIKTTDNTAITATTKLISDGLGNDTCIKVGTAGTDFLGNVDFSAATVTGLPGGAAGLVSGTGLDSMQSDASLTTVAANASGTRAIALGDGSVSSSGNTVAIGWNSNASGNNSMAIGPDSATASTCRSIAIGPSARATGFQFPVAIGYAACAPQSSSIAIGNNTNAGYGIAIGNSVTAFSGGQAVSIGHFSDATGNESTAYGYNAQATASYSVALGSASSASAIGAIAIGRNISATAAGAVGLNTSASIADTVSVKALETQTASTPTAGGIIMTDAGSVARRLNIDASGNLQIDSTPVGGGGAAGLVSGTGTDSLKNADSLVTTPAVAACPGSIALGNGATANPAFGITGAIVIGCNASTTRGGVVAIGGGATSSDGNGTVVGYGAAVTNNHGTALGYQSRAGACGVAVGDQACASLAHTVAVGKLACALATCSIAIGCTACVSATGQCGVAIGSFARAEGNGVAIGQNSFNAAQCGNIAIGGGACASATASEGAGAIGYSARVCAGRSFGVGYTVKICNSGSTDSIAFGNNASIGDPTGINAFTCGSALGTNTRVCANSATAIGAGVTAFRANTVTGCQMEACVAGKGIVVTSPDGLTTLGIGIDNSGNIVTYTP